MRPIAIFRHFRSEGPGYFAIFLERHGIPWQLIAVDEGRGIPGSPAAYSGLCFMGGPMSVNDPLPWIADACSIIRQAVASDIPVIGHCLGGQLISKALGGVVSRNPRKEIGWGEAESVPGPDAAQWLGDFVDRKLTVFQWHGETFSIPPQASRILASAYCANQMFTRGPHLAMQCHVEMTPEMITKWSKGWDDEVCGMAELPASIQNPATMGAEAGEKLPVMRTLADQLYSVWIQGLKKD